MEKTFDRVRSTKDILTIALLIVLGSILVALPTGAGINVAGFFAIFAGLILAFVLRSSYKDVETGAKYQKKEMYFQQAVRAKLMEAIESKPNYLDLYEEGEGNSLKLDVYFSKASGKAYIQLFEYIPYSYQPCTKVYEYGLEEVDKLIK